MPKLLSSYVELLISLAAGPEIYVIDGNFSIGYFSLTSWAFFKEAMQQILEQYMLPTVASLEPTHWRKAMDLAIWPVEGLTTSASPGGACCIEHPL